MFDVRTYVILRHFCELLLLTSKGYRQQILNGHEKKKEDKKKRKRKKLVGRKYSTLCSIFIEFFSCFAPGTGKRGVRGSKRNLKVARYRSSPYCGQHVVMKGIQARVAAAIKATGDMSAANFRC